MNTITSLHWPLVIGLGVFALVRPAPRIVEDQLGISGTPAAPIVATLIVSAVWILVVGLSRVGHPVLTLLFAGLSYAVLSTVLGGVLSPILTGRFQGPLATPIAIVPVLLTNAVWGLAAGGLAFLLQRLRGVRHAPVPPPGR